MIEVEEYTERQRQEMESNAKQAYNRYIRDENSRLERSRSLNKLMDQEAAESMLQLENINKDIELKTSLYNSRIEDVQAKLNE